MQGNLPWSRQLSVDSSWHRTDPRVRLALSIVLSGTALASRSRWEFALLYGSLALLYLFSRTGIRTAWSGFRPFLFLVFLTALLQLFFTPGESLVPSGPLSAVTYEGLRLGAVIVARLAAVILISTNLVVTTSPLELSRSLGWFFLPGRRLGLPVEDLVLILSLGFQFFPLLIDESRSLRLALESRGISVRHPRLVMRLRALGAWVLAMLTAVMERSHRQAMALEAKNFGRVNGLRLRFPPWRSENLFLVAGGVVALGGWIALRSLAAPNF